MHARIHFGSPLECDTTVLYWLRVILGQVD